MLNYGLELTGTERDEAVWDLVAEGAALDEVVAGEADWDQLTPAAGWTVAHQIAHLAAADRNTLLAVKSPERFSEVIGRSADLDAEAGAALPRDTLLEQWRAGRDELAGVLKDLPADYAFPWYGSDLTAPMMAPMRVMETWAHGQDIYDTLGVEHPPSDALRHVAALGVAGRALGFVAGGLPVPTEAVRVELTGPGAGTWGPEDAEQRVEGSALDFALRVTLRRSRSETDLKAVGEDAEQWLDVARVFL
ncbi:maleylpyruvate isomerase family mycothiol-dependent enzyme [Kribbella sp. NBC_01505]|uniref:maleylpyruvate isomerase family mycothiol-dependent enzyme n=1 Tax=Kribbella sp. NBC_01505 TaxID=2903580 RepID=UPI003870C875